MESTQAGPIKKNLSFDVLTYEAPFLIEKLLKNAITDSIEEAELLFTEVKKWMLLGESDKSKMWQMYSLRIDEVWHQFILFTYEYTKFCNHYFDTYLPHSPGNAPGIKDIDPSILGSFEEFEQAYQRFFGMELPEIWFDEKNITVNRRILNEKTENLFLEYDDNGMINMINDDGFILLSINLFARDAMEFIVSTKAFYTRELPGDLTDEEKIQLISTMIKFKILRTAA